jgi:hypothetical protein
MTSPQPKEIYLVPIKKGYSTDHRPAVIIEILPNQNVKIAVISSALDLYTPTTDFLISNVHPDFAATGLIRTSYVCGQNFYECFTSVLSKKRLGILTGDLAKALDDWLGN